MHNITNKWTLQKQEIKQQFHRQYSNCLQVKEVREIILSDKSLLRNLRPHLCLLPWKDICYPSCLSLGHIFKTQNCPRYCLSDCVSSWLLNQLLWLSTISWLEQSCFFKSPHLMLVNHEMSVELINAVALQMVSWWPFIIEKINIKGPDYRSVSLKSSSSHRQLLLICCSR